MSESQGQRWIYPIVSMSSSKRGRRALTQPGVCYDLIGVDGSVDGGAGFHYGFKKVWDLTGVAETGRNAFQTMVGREGVTFRIDSGESAWGFVYGVWDSGTKRLKVFVEYAKGSDTTQLGPVLIKEVASYENGDQRQMSVVVQGRFVFVFLEGEEPCFFYYDTDTSAIVAHTNTGPGEQPLLDTSEAVVSNSMLPTLVAEDGISLTTTGAALAQFGVPSGDVPAQARVFLVFFYGDTTLTGLGEDTVLHGPTDMGLWTVTPPGMTDPVIDGGGTERVEFWRSGLGALSGLSTRIQREPSQYAFAYQLYDSVTGRKSQLSQLATTAVGSNVAQNLETLNYQSEWVLFGLLELVYDSSLYDRVLVYRSTRGLNNTTLSLDDDVLLSDFVATDQTLMTGAFKRAYYFYQLVDPVLAGQETFLGDVVYEANMPTAGAALLYEGSMLFGNTTAFDAQRGGLGVVRWSNPYDVSPEDVSPLNRYFLVRPDEEIIAFKRAGPNVIGFSNTGLYQCRKENFVVKWTPIHEGLGLPGFYGSEVVGSTVYYVTETGEKGVGPDGMIDAVHVLDKLIQEDWAGQVQQVQQVYDATTECLYLLNPGQEHMAIMWLKTSMLSELYDAGFVHVSRGNVPRDVGVSNDYLQPRAVFWQKVEPSGSGADPRWRTFVADYRREKASRGRMLDFTGSTARFSLGQDFTSGVMLAGTNAVFTAGSNIEGCKLYVLNGPLAGRSATIRRRVDDFNVELEASDAANLYGITASNTVDGMGTRLGITPVYFRAVFSALGLVPNARGEGGAADMWDYMKVRHAASVGAAFTDLTGEAAADVVNCDARFASLIYKGNSETWVGYPTRKYPTLGDGSKVCSVTEGPSIYQAQAVEGPGYIGAALFPGVEIICPDLDFSMLNVLVVGTVREADSEQFPG